MFSREKQSQVWPFFLAIVLIVALCTTGCGTQEPAEFVSLEEFSRCKKDMTLQAVVAIVGPPSVLDDDREHNGVTFRTYSWINPDKSFMKASFQNDILYMASQHALRSDGTKIAMEAPQLPEFTPPPEQPQVDALHMRVKPPAQAPTVTMAHYMQLKKGMTYNQVVNFLGSPGTLKYDSRSKFGSSSWYKWENADGSFVSVDFDDGELTGISQYGLQ